MNWFQSFFLKIRQLFQGESTKSALENGVNFVGQALPYVRIIGDIVTLTPLPQMMGVPQGVDDKVWADIKGKFPTLLDGRSKTAEELKADALIAAAALLQSKYPELTTGAARIAAELAYQKNKDEKKKKKDKSKKNKA